MSTVNHTAGRRGAMGSSGRRGLFSLPPVLHAWLVWAVSTLFVLFQFFLQLSAGDIVSGLMHSYSLSACGAGFLAGSYSILYVIFQIPAGLLVDHFGPRRLLSVGAIVVMFGCCVFATAHVLVLAFIGRLMMGAGAAFAFVGCLYLIGTWFPPRRFGFMTSIAETFGMLGSIAGGIFLAAMVSVHGWRNCMLVAAILSVGLAVLLWAVIRDQPAQVTPPPRRELKSFLPAVKTLMSSRVAWFNGLYCGITFSVFTVVVALWGVPFMQLSHHLSLAQATSVCDVAFLGAAIGCPILGVLDIRYHLRHFMMSTGPLFAALFLCLIIYCPTMPLWLDYLLMLLMGISISNYMLNFVVANQIAEPHARAISIGFVNTFCVGTAPIFQPLVGYVLDRFAIHTAHGVVYNVHAYQWALSIIPLALIGSACLAFYLPKRAD
jgi:MFS family permease